jgi:hypothetical protein
MISDYNVTSKAARLLKASATLFFCPAVLLPCLVLEQSYPPSVHLVQVALGIDKFQSLMVAIQNKLLLDQIMSPMLQTPDNSIEFQLISSPFLLSFIQFLTKELNGPSFL